MENNSHDYLSILEAKNKEKGVFSKLGTSKQIKFSAAEIKGSRRPTQEDEMGLAVVEIENPEDYFSREYEKMVEKNKDKTSGTTAAMYYLDPEERTITTANLGDSRVYLTIKDNSKNSAKYTTILLTQDQDLSLSRVKEHIENCGGYVDFNTGNVPRINGKLAVGGAIGDQLFPVLRKPDIAKIKIDDLVKYVGIQDINQCEFIITNACDGLTNHTNDNNHEFGIEFDEKGYAYLIDKRNKTRNKTDYLEVSGRGQNLSNLIALQEFVKDETELSEFLVKNADNNNCGDNISVSNCYFNLLNPKKEKGVLGFIFDGHGGADVSKNCLEHMKSSITKLQQDNNKMLFDAVCNDDLDLDKIDNLLKLGANPNIFDKKFEATPLFAAAQNGNFKIVKLLLEVDGIDVNKGLDKYGTTPLYIAIQEGHKNIAWLLIQQKGIDVNKPLIKNAENIPQNTTALYLAAKLNYAHIVEYLLNAGADPSILTHTGKSPLDVAKDNEIKQMLTKALEKNTTNESFRPTTEKEYKDKLEVKELIVLKKQPPKELNVIDNSKPITLKNSKKLENNQTDKINRK